MEYFKYRLNYWYKDIISSLIYVLEEPSNNSEVDHCFDFDATDSALESSQLTDVFLFCMKWRL